MSFQQIEKYYTHFPKNYKSFSYKLENTLLIITLNKKPGNTMDLTFFSEVYHIFKTINHTEKDIRCVILKSSLKNFTFGLDLKQTANDLFKKDDNDTARQVFFLEKYIKKMQKSFLQIEKCKVPVIAIVRGYCIGAGIDMISACDMVYSDRSSKFSIREIKIGLAADLGTLNRLGAWVKNQSLLKEIAYTGRFFGFQEAEDLGLIYKCLEISKLDTHVINVCKEICGNSPVAVMMTKRGINFMKKRNIKDGLDFMKHQNKSFIITDDVMKSVGSIFNKEKPIFPKL